MNPRIAAFYVLFASVFGFSLYVTACTASITPSYLSGIIYIRWFSPFLVLIFSFGLVSFFAQHSREITRFVQLAWVLCSIVFVMVLSSESSHRTFTPEPPPERTIYSTVSFALVEPQFSNRSYSGPIYSAVLAGLLWLIHRARNKSGHQSHTG